MLLKLWKRLSPQKEANRKLEWAEGEMLKHPQIECPVTNLFAPGVYWREVVMPAGGIYLGHEHKTKHFNVALTGRAKVLANGVVTEIVAPCVFVSESGTRKLFYVQEDLRFATIHPTKITNVDKLEKKLVRQSKTWVAAHELKQLKGE